ncbi:DUF4124 domain-containing protein [Porticoccus sp.]
MLGLLTSGLASADLYSCVEPSGKTTFSDRPCTAVGSATTDSKQSVVTPKAGKTGDAQGTKKRQGLGSYLDRAEKMSAKDRQQP